MHLFPCPRSTLTINPTEQQCERLLTRAQFVRGRLAFLSGDQPVHFIKHSVNLRQDQQLGQEIKMKMKMASTPSKLILRYRCHGKSEASGYRKILTAAVVAVFMLTMAKWDCFSTSTSWSHREKRRQNKKNTPFKKWHVNFKLGQVIVINVLLVLHN